MTALEVDRVLVLEPVLLIARDEGKVVDVTVQFGEWEFDRRDAIAREQRQVALLVRLQVMERDSSKVGDDNVAWDFVFAALAEQVLNVAEGLRLGFAQVFAKTLVLDEQHVGPEEVDVAVFAGDFPHRLLERSHSPAANAEDLEKVVPKRLLLCPLTPSTGPIAGEANSVLSNFIPRQRHIGPFSAFGGREATRNPPRSIAIAPLNDKQRDTCSSGRK